MPDRQLIVVFVVTEDWYFCSHRLPLAIAAKNAGYTVFVVTRESEHGERIRAAGIGLIPLDFKRRSINPLHGVSMVWRLRKIYRRISPDIVHHVALKPVLFGSLAARLARVPATVNAMAGLGYVFSSQELKARIARPIVLRIFRALLGGKRSRLILQNADDVKMFKHFRLIEPENIRLVRGAGVDPDEYTAEECDNEPVTVLFAARLLRSKGLAELIAAGKILRERGVTLRIVIAGEPDSHNPEAVSNEDLKTWQSDEDFDFLGHRIDMVDLYRSCDIVCLPSYREGLPKTLIEAAACGRAIVTTDVPGCREIVEDGINGYLVPARDPERLADALEKLIRNPEARAAMGAAGRQMVIDQFSIHSVVADTLAIYGELAS